MVLGPSAGKKVGPKRAPRFAIGLGHPESPSEFDTLAAVDVTEFEWGEIVVWCLVNNLRVRTILVRV